MKSCVPGDGSIVHPTLRQLHIKPDVTFIKGVLSHAERKYLLRQARGWRASQTTGANRGQRRSETAVLRDGPVVECIRRRLAKLAGMPSDKMELQLTRYRHGQQYKAHHDDPGVGPKRLKTLFAYLDERSLASGKCGGATWFPKLRSKGRPLRVFPKKGDALMWTNFKPNGRHDPGALHAGEALTCKNTRKTGLNVWFRDGV